MPLHQAVLEDNLDAVVQLVKAGADVDAQDNYLTALQCCKSPGDIAGTFRIFRGQFILVVKGRKEKKMTE